MGPTRLARLRGGNFRGLANVSGAVRCLIVAALLGGAVSAAASTDLMSAYVQALDHNAMYQAAVASYQQATEARPQAIAKLLPQIAAGGNIGRIEQSVSGQFFLGQPLINGGNGVSSDRDEYFTRYAYGVGLTQVLFHWDLFLGLSQSKVKIAAAKVALLNAQNKLRLSVAKAYFDVLSTRSQAQLAKAERDVLVQVAQQTADRFNAGLVSDADNKQAQAAADGAKAALIAANAQVQVAKALLMRATGTSLGALAPLNEEVRLPAPKPDDIKSWVKHAATQNLQVGLSKLKTQIATYSLRMARAKRLPTLDAQASREYDYATGGITSGIGAGNNHALDQRVMLQLKIPIFTGGAIASAVRAAQDGVQHARALHTASVDRAESDARVAFLKAEAGRARLSALRQAMASTQAAEKAARVAYKVGTQTYVDVATAIQKRYEAQGNFAQARYNYLLDTLKLKNAAGSLSADDLQRINRWLR